MYASHSALWFCILFYAIEAGRHRLAPSVCSLTLILPRCPPGVYTQRFDDIIGNFGELKWSSTLWTAKIENREVQGSKVCVFLLCWCGALLLASSRVLLLAAPQSIWGAHLLTPQEGIYPSLEFRKAFHVSTFKQTLFSYQKISSPS